MMRTTHDKSLEKKLNRVAVLLSVVVMAAVVMMRRVSFDVNVDLSFLPAFHSSVNVLCGIVLLLALYYIKTGQKLRHRNAIYLAMTLSAIFLMSYILYHVTNDPVTYCKEDWTRAVYFVLLITHIILAAIILPLVLFTFNRAYSGDYGRHRKLARIVFPIWLYVVFSGPAAYLMLLPCF